MPTLMQRIRRVLPYLRGNQHGLLAALGAAVITAATEPMIPTLMNHLLDRGFIRGQLPLWMVPASIVGLFAVRSIAGFISHYGLAWTASRTVLRLRDAMFGRVLTATPVLFGQHTGSSLTNTLVYEAQAGVTLIVNSTQVLVRDALTLVALLGYLLYLNWQLTLFVAVLFPTVAFVMRIIGRRLHRLTIESQHATDSLAYVVEENVLAWRSVRLYGAQQQQRSRFIGAADSVRRLTLKSVVAAASMTPVTQMLASVALSAVIVIALWQASGGGSSVGAFVAFVMAMLQLVAPVKHLSDVVPPLTRGLAAIERGIGMIENTPAERGGSHVAARARGEIVFDGVGLRYRDDGLPALTDVSLTVHAGETVALVGPSGAGKTTLVNLLPRFIEPGSGRITLDGVALADWDLDALRRQFALVSQDVVLFNDTVARNVSLGVEMSRQQIEDALRAANLLDFVLTLPQGMDTPIGHNGSQLSGGQRQRLAIARAVARDAPVLILDEATSALDSESERAVQDALDRLMQGRTTLVIAHRLSTIEHADRVAALEGGRLAELGTHAELLAKGGLYARLHAMQFRT